MCLLRLGVDYIELERYKQAFDKYDEVSKTKKKQHTGKATETHMIICWYLEISDVSISIHTYTYISKNIICRCNFYISAKDSKIVAPADHLEGLMVFVLVKFDAGWQRSSWVAFWRKRRQVQQSFSHLFLSFAHFLLKAIDMDEFECLLSDLLKAMSGNRICAKSKVR